MSFSSPLLLADHSALNSAMPDCACPDIELAQVRPSPPDSIFAKSRDTLEIGLSADYRLVFSATSTDGPCVLNETAWQIWQAFESEPRSLSTDFHQELAARQLITSNHASVQPESGHATSLIAWLHVTNACNLDCPYCYVRKSSERMSEPVGQNAVKQIFAAAQQHHFKKVKLKYAGGEATLHFNLVRQLHDYASALSEQTGILLDEVVLSNGTHIPAEIADWFVQTGVRLMISLDGVGRAHDAQRPLKGGGKSFARIEQTVDTVLLPRQIRPDISITVTGLNASAASEAVLWAIKRDLAFSLNFYRQNAQSASRQDLILEEQAIITGMLAAYQAIEAHLPTRSFLNGLLDRVQAQAHTHTCGAGHSYIVITHTGALAQCQMHLQQPVGMQIDASSMLSLIHNGPIQNLSVDQKEGCRDCSFRYRCTGGCPLETYRATGRWDVQSPNCHIYKRLYPEALRLEGLRLLKINGLLPLTATVKHAIG